MKTYGVVKVQPHSFKISALDGCQCSASCPGRFTPGEKVPGAAAAAAATTTTITTTTTTNNNNSNNNNNQLLMYIPTSLVKFETKNC
jgi:hypothetical protein